MKKAYVSVQRNSRGKVSTECATFAMKEREPLAFCRLDDREVVDSFNVFLKDPTVASFETVMERALHGYLVAGMAVLLGFVPFVLALILLWRLRRGTVYRTVKREYLP